MSKYNFQKEFGKTWLLAERIDIVCQRVRIPDLRTRSGLRKVHRDFPGIFQRIDTCYHDNVKHRAVQEIIVSIYARMSADSLLRDKLFKEGFLLHIMPLLDVPTCRYAALQCLSTVTHHGGRDTRNYIAIHTPALVKLAWENINDRFITEHCIVIVAHSAITVVCPPKGVPDENMLASLGSLQDLFKLILTIFEQPTCSHKAFTHGMGLLLAAVHHCRDAYTSYSPTISFLVACLRSKHIRVRMCTFSALLRLQNAVAEKETPSLDHYKLIAKVKGPKSPVITKTLVRYGMDRAEITTYMRTTVDYQKALFQCTKDHDMYSLGMKLYALIGRTEFSVGDGEFQDVNDKPFDIGLPFIRWHDALPFCADAIRSRGDPAERDAANIVELKYFLLKSRTEEAHAKASEALKNGPDIAFYYFVLAITAPNHREGLQWAKKGLRCKGPSLTPYVRFSLLFTALEDAGLLGLECLDHEWSPRGGKTWDESYTFMRSALEDSKIFIAEAPPDSRNMSAAILWCMLLTITLRGPELGTELLELHDLMEKRKVAEELQAFIHSTPVPPTRLRLTCRDILEHYKSGSVRWKKVLTRFDALGSEGDRGSKAVVLSRSPDEQIAGWLEGTTLDDDEEDEVKPEPRMCTHSSINGQTLELKKCTHCGNPSALLKKCTRCLKTRYCDASCQKAHWTEHKKVCKPPG